MSDHTTPEDSGADEDRSFQRRQADYRAQDAAWDRRRVTRQDARRRPSATA